MKYCLSVAFCLLSALATPLSNATGTHAPGNDIDIANVNVNRNHVANNNRNLNRNDNSNSNRNSNHNNNSNNNNNQNTNTNSNKNTNTNTLSSRNNNTNRNEQSQAQQQQQQQGQQQSIRNSGNSSSRSTGIGIGGSQSQSNANRVNAGNNNGNLSNTGNNAGNSTSASNASQYVGGDTFVQQAQARNPVSSAIAAPLTTGADSCMGSTSMGAQGVGLGLSLGSTWNDENCVMLKNSMLLWNMGKQEAAIALLCQNPKLREALEMSGTECPQTARQRQLQRTVTYDTTDPYIAARMKHQATPTP